jgi:hypothetical protein
MRINKENTKRIILIESTKIKYYDREFYIKINEIEEKVMDNMKNFYNALYELRKNINENK